MTKRKSTGKRLRFSVFHRDQFTCQYCGAQPPDVVLVCDHIVPVAQGGDTTLDSLITACETCNAGKADRSLEDRPVRPDADLMYLEVQQEIAELRRYQASLAEREEAFAEILSAWGDLWCQYSREDWTPSDGILRALYDRYGSEIVEEALTDVACKIGSGYLSAFGTKWVAYLHAVARNLASDGAGGDE